MVSLNFQERFKDKISAISKLGQIGIQNSKPIAKERSGRGSALKSLANSILKANEPRDDWGIHGKFASKDLNQSVTEASSVSGRKSNYSSSPMPHSISRSIDPATRFSNFVPYTLREYKNIKSDQYFELGRLGASATDLWKAKKDALKKRIDYAQRANFVNLNKKPLRRFKLFSGQDNH